MTSLTSYAAQTILLATLLLVFSYRKQHIDAFIALIVVFWVIVVIAIYYRYGADQIYFYSNDQAFHWRLLNYYLPNEGVSLEIGKVLTWRYPVILPAYYISKIGFDGILLLKFSQLVYLVLIYTSGKRFLVQNNIKARYWHIIFIAGPTLIIMSTFALRDLAVAFFFMSSIIGKNPSLRIIGFVATSLLRPHLAAALMFGLLASIAFKRVKNRLFIPTLTLSTIGAYILGTYTYYLGAIIQSGVPIQSPNEIFSQLKITRLAANFLGLQFLTLDITVVKASITTLFLSRLIFFDTFLIPMSFLIVLLFSQIKWDQTRMTIYFTFIFFYGLISNTDWNSSRQNIPFFVMMGLAAIVGIEARKASREEPVA